MYLPSFGCPKDCSVVFDCECALACAHSIACPNYPAVPCTTSSNINCATLNINDSSVRATREPLRKLRAWYIPSPPIRIIALAFTFVPFTPSKHPYPFIPSFPPRKNAIANGAALDFKQGSSKSHLHTWLTLFETTSYSLRKLT